MQNAAEKNTDSTFSKQNVDDHVVEQSEQRHHTPAEENSEEAHMQVKEVPSLFLIPSSSGERPRKHAS